MEGTSGKQVPKTTPEAAFWGGSLASARENPVRLDRPDRLVYSPHVYGPGMCFHQRYSRFPWSLPPIMAEKDTSLKQKSLDKSFSPSLWIAGLEILCCPMLHTPLRLGMANGLLSIIVVFATLTRPIGAGLQVSTCKSTLRIRASQTICQASGHGSGVIFCTLPKQVLLSSQVGRKSLNASHKQCMKSAVLFAILAKPQLFCTGFYFELSRKVGLEAQP